MFLGDGASRRGDFIVEAFKHLSFPLLGDVKYGKGELNRMFRERTELNRLMLRVLWLLSTRNAKTSQDYRPFLADERAILERWPIIQTESLLFV